MKKNEKKFQEINRYSNIDTITKKEDIFFSCILLLGMLSNDETYKATSELAYMCNEDSFVNIIKCLGGQTIRIPTEQEVKTMLRVLLLNQYFNVDKLEWQEALEKAGFDRCEGREAAKALKCLENSIDKNLINFGGIFAE